MKKIISLFLAALFLIIYPIDVFASGLNNPKSVITKESILEVASLNGVDLRYLSNDEYVDMKKTNQTGSFFTEIRKENSVDYKFIEDEKSATLTIQSTGDVLIDGKPVTVETSEVETGFVSRDILNFNEVILRAHSVHHWVKLPNGLTDADLPNHLGMVQKQIKFGDRILKSLPSATFFAIVGLALGAVPGAIVGIVGGSVYSAAVQGYPYNNALSVKIAKRQGNNVGGYLVIQKVYTEYYGTEQYTGYLGNTVHYTGYDS